MSYSRYHRTLCETHRASSDGRRTISVQFILGPEGTQVTATERVFGGAWRWDRHAHSWTLPTRSTDPATFSVIAALKQLTEELQREL